MSYASCCSSESHSKMAPENKYPSLTNREQRRIANIEDINHVLEQLWDHKLDELFHKMISRKAETGIKGLFTMTIDELLDFTYREDSDSLFLSWQARCAKYTCYLIMSFICWEK